MDLFLRDCASLALLINSEIIGAWRATLPLRNVQTPECVLASQHLSRQRKEAVEVSWDWTVNVIFSLETDAGWWNKEGQWDKWSSASYWTLTTSRDLLLFVCHVMCEQQGELLLHLCPSRLHVSKLTVQTLQKEAFCVCKVFFCQSLVCVTSWLCVHVCINVNRLLNYCFGFFIYLKFCCVYVVLQS